MKLKKPEYKHFNKKDSKYAIAGFAFCMFLVILVQLIRG